MIDVYCQGCMAERQYSTDSLKDGLFDGSIVVGEYTSRQQVGMAANDTRTIFVKAFLRVCKACQGKSPAEGENTRAVSDGQEAAEIQRIMHGVRTEHPEWTLEEAAHEAVERHNDVSRERNIGFRVYLMDSEPKHVTPSAFDAAT